MKRSHSKTGRYFRDATSGQRRAALIAGLLCIVLLVASITTFFVLESNALRPTPTTAAESQYLRARDAESQAIADAQAAGRAVGSDPAVVTARINIADAQLSMGQQNAAARTIDAVIRDNPENLRAQVLQGNVYEVLGDKNRALEIYRRILEQDLSRDPEVRREALRGIGNSLIALGDSVQALDSFTQAALVPPESITLHLTAGTLALELERWQTAATHFYSVLRFEPSNEIALENLSMLERDHSAEAQAALADLVGGTAYQDAGVGVDTTNAEDSD